MSPLLIQTCDRRRFLTGVSTVAAAWTVFRATRAVGEIQSETPLKNAIFLGEKSVEWQAPYGGPDPEKCPYRTSVAFDACHMHGCGPMARALYRLYEVTRDAKYKAAADCYALFLINALHDPPVPFANTIEINGVRRTSLSSAWMYGKALAPCYEEMS